MRGRRDSYESPISHSCSYLLSVKGEIHAHKFLEKLVILWYLDRIRISFIWLVPSY